MRIGVGMIGAGFAADIHARAYAEIHEFDLELAAVAAASLGKAHAFAARHSVHDAYDDYRRILERDDINLVDICTPNDSNKAAMCFICHQFTK